jgi:hypothetical protein
MITAIEPGRMNKHYAGGDLTGLVAIKRKVIYILPAKQGVVAELGKRLPWKCSVAGSNPVASMISLVLLISTCNGSTGSYSHRGIGTQLSVRDGVRHWPKE